MTLRNNKPLPAWAAQLGSFGLILIFLASNIRYGIELRWSIITLLVVIFGGSELAQRHPDWFGGKRNDKSSNDK